MSVVGPFLVIALVLMVSGATKLASPAPAAALVSSVVGRRVPTGSGRLIGVGEIALGAWALAGSRLAAAVLGLAYLAFAAVADVARRRGVANCGCFGAAAAPPGWAHVVADGVSAVVAFVAAALTVDRSVGVAFGHGPALATATVVALAAAVTLIIGWETVAAEVRSARRALAVRADDTPGPRRR